MKFLMEFLWRYSENEGFGRNSVFNNIYYYVYFDLIEGYNNVSIDLKGGFWQMIDDEEGDSQDPEGFKKPRPFNPETFPCVSEPKWN